MLSRGSAGDLEACSVLAKQVRNASHVTLEEPGPFNTVGEHRRVSASFIYRNGEHCSLLFG